MVGPKFGKDGDRYPSFETAEDYYKAIATQY